MKYADVRLGHSDSKLHHVPPVPLHFHLQLSHQCRSQPYQVVVFDRLASAASSVSFQLAPLSASAFCWVVPVTPLLLPGQAETSMVAVWPPEPLAPLINHQDDYFARWLPHCMWGKKTWQLHYLYVCLSSDVGHMTMTDHHPWSETYPNWLRLIGHVRYLVKYNSQVSPASEVWRDRWVGGTTRPTLSCPRFFHTNMTPTACSLPNLARGIFGGFPNQTSPNDLTMFGRGCIPPRLVTSGVPGGAEAWKCFQKFENLHFPKSFLFPSFKKRIINIQSRIAKNQETNKNPHRIPKSILNNMPYTSAFGWTSGWIIRGGTTLQSFNRSALDAWMDRYQHSNHGIWWNMNMHLCMEMYAVYAKGFANIWVKGVPLLTCLFLEPLLPCHHLCGP